MTKTALGYGDDRWNRHPFGQNPYQDGFGSEGRPDADKFNKMNGIKTSQPRQNRVDFGPANDNYDDRL